MQKMQERSKKQNTLPARTGQNKALPARAGQNKQRPFSSSSASSSSSSPPALAGAAAPAAGKGGGKNVDKLLFKNLVEMVPLVETLMEKKPNPAFTRRASIVHTPAQVKKVPNSTPKPINKTKSVAPKNPKTPNESISKTKRDSSRSNSSSGSKPLGLSRNLKKEREELALLQEQVKDLESKLLEKESALKSAQDSIEEMNLVSEALEETKRQLDDKESLVKSASDELYDAKIALADKQAALEKLEWEGKMSSQKVKELEGDMADMNDEISVLMDVFEKFSPTNNSKSKESEEGEEEDDENDSSLEIEPISLEDDLVEIDMEKMEVEISKYIIALEAAKVNPSEESLDMVAQERLRLQALVLSS